MSRRLELSEGVKLTIGLIFCIGFVWGMMELDAYLGPASKAAGTTPTPAEPSPTSRPTPPADNDPDCRTINANTLPWASSAAKELGFGLEDPGELVWWNYFGTIDAPVVTTVSFEAKYKGLPHTVHNRDRFCKVPFKK